MRAKNAATLPVLTIGVQSGPQVSLDPAKDGIVNWSVVRPLVTESLIHMNPHGTFSPALASSWQYLKAKPHSGRANKDFAFTLRHDARFSDGTPVNAQSVITWLNYVAQANGPVVPFLGPISSIEAVGNWTVRIHLKSPNPSIPYALSDLNGWGEVESPSAVANPSNMSTQTFGAGPYMLDPSQTVAGDHYTFVPNPYFYDKSQMKWSQVVTKTISNASSMLQAIQTGQIDVAAGDASTANAAADAGLYVFHAPSTVAEFTLDSGGTVSTPLSDVRVRQAMNYAIDRKTIASAILGKYGSATSQIASSDGVDAQYSKYYTYDPIKAKSLLAAAGYANGVTINGVIVSPGSPAVPIAQAVAQNLDQVGIHLNLTLEPTGGAYVTDVLGTTPHSMLYAPSQDSRPMWAQYGIYMKAGGVFDHIGWHDRGIDQLWLKGQRSADPTAEWKQISARATTQAFFLPILATDAIWYVTKNVRGVVVARERQLPLASEWSPPKS